jgi:hypothetical protein
MVIDLYDNGAASNRGYDIYSFSFGNLASTIKVIPTATPPYLTFTPTTFTSSISSPSQYLWFYINTGSAFTSSTITVYRQDDTLSSHLATGVLSISYTGVCTILATSKNCLIVSQGTTTYNLYTLSQNSNTLAFSSADISLWAGMTTSTIWKVNDDCSKFSKGKFVFAYSTTSSDFAFVSNTQNLVWTAIDSTLTYAYVSGVIWKYNSAKNLYVSYYTNISSSSYTTPTLVSYNNQLIIHQ